MPIQEEVIVHDYTKRFINLLFKLFEYSVRLNFHLRTSVGYELYFILISDSIHFIY